MGNRNYARLPKLIEITDDMPTSIREEAISHNAGIKRIEEQRARPIQEQVKRLFQWEEELA